MPFEPLTPEEAERFRPPCRDSEHNPPSHIFVTHPTKWVCPSCGAVAFLWPQIATCTISTGTPASSIRGPFA